MTAVAGGRRVLRVCRGATILKVVLLLPRLVDSARCLMIVSRSVATSVSTQAAVRAEVAAGRRPPRVHRGASAVHRLNPHSMQRTKARSISEVSQELSLPERHLQCPQAGWICSVSIEAQSLGLSSFATAEILRSATGMFS